MIRAASLAILLLSATAYGQEQPQYAQPYGYYAPPPPPPVPRAQKHFALKLSAGYTRSWLYSIPLSMGSIEGAPGVTWQKQDWGLDLLFGLGYSAGRSEYGLGVRQTIFRPGVQFRFSHVVLGAGLSLGYLSIDRATHVGSMAGATSALHVTIGVEPFEWDGHGISIEARGESDPLTGLYGVTIGAAFRY